MNTPIGLYRSHAASIDRIVQTTVGRAEMLEDLLEKLQKNAGKKGGQHYLFIGPRGIGKTHFLSLVKKAVETREILNGSYTVIRFPEENNRILCFADILLEIVQNLGETEDGAEWREMHASISAMNNDQEIVDAVVPRLRQYRQQSKKTLLLLMENLNALFGEQIKNEQDIHRLRTFLMDSPCATLIGTSPVYFPGITSMQKPFFDFFDIQVLEDLSEEMTLDLVKKNLELENRQDLLDRLDELSPKIRALHTMTGGNPRLVMMLYELIAYDNILEVQVQFQKLLDQITPFYQDRMKDLAPQERALLETMALMRTEPRTPLAIAARMRKPPQQISSLLKRMITSGYLTVAAHPLDKRSRLYRIKEGFFDLWLAMSGSRAVRKRLGYLVKLFEIWYQDRMARDKKRLELRQQFEVEHKPAGAQENNLVYLDYLAELGDCDERCEAKLKLSLDYLKIGEALKAKDLLAEVQPLAQTPGIFTWMTGQALQWADSGTDRDVEQWFDDLIEYWKIQRSGDLERAVDIAQRLGTDLSDKGLHKIRIELLRDALSCATLPRDQITLSLQIAKSQSMDGQLDNSLQSLQTALQICREIGDKASEGTTLNNISQIHDARGDYDTALQYLQQSLAIFREIGEKTGEGATLNNISLIHRAWGDYDTALQYLQQSLVIRQEIGDKAGEGITLNNISQVHDTRGNYNDALQFLQQALAIQQQIGDKAGEGVTLNNISSIHRARGDYDTALQYLRQSLVLREEIGDKAGLCATLFNIGHIHLQNDEKPQAVQVWVTVYRIAKSMNLAQALDALAKLANHLNLDGGLEAWERLSRQMEETT